MRNKKNKNQEEFQTRKCSYNGLAIAKRVYETGKHIDTNSVNKMHQESGLLLTYMIRELHLDKKECYRRWLELDNKIETPCTWDEFEHYYEIAEKTEFNLRMKSFKIFQSEIDIIKSYDISLVGKEMALLLIAYCKSKRMWIYPSTLSDIMQLLSEYYHVRDCYVNSKYNDRIDELKKVGLIESVAKGKARWDPVEGEWDEPDHNDVMNKLPEEGEVVLESDIFYDVTELFDLFKTKICSCCGKEFSITLKNQTNLCGDCYKLRRREDKTKTMRNSQNFIGVEIRICEDCGKEFECTGKCQRTKCEECYKKYRKIIILNAVKTSKIKKKNG